MSIKFWLDTFSLVFMGAFILWVMWDSTNIIKIHCPRCKKFDWKYERHFKAHICKKCGYKLKDISDDEVNEYLNEYEEEK